VRGQGKRDQPRFGRIFENGTHEVPPRNSPMMASLSFCTISPCIAETVKFAVRIFSVNQSTYTKTRVSDSVSRICRFLDIPKRSKRTMMSNAGMFSGGVALVVGDTINEQKARRTEQGSRGRRKRTGRELRRIWATYLPSGVTEDDGLGDRQCIIQVAESVEFPFLLLHSDEELFDALERQLITFDEDANWVGHEFGRHLQNVVRKRGAQQDDLCGRWEVSIDLVDLVLETLVQQLVRLVEYEHLDVPRPKTPPPNHIENASRRTRHDVLPIFEFTNILANGGATNTRVALDVHVVS
jgi:hypothetical protein